MALTERSEYKVEIIPPYSTLQVRRADIIERDGVEIARSYNRHCLQPGADVSNECDVVKAIAPDVWTADVVSAYEAMVEEASLPKEEVSTMPAPEEGVSTMPASEEAN